MEKDEFKIILSIFLTIALVIILIFSSNRAEKLLAGGSKVDIKKIEELVKEGKLSLHPCEFFKLMTEKELEEEFK